MYSVGVFAAFNLFIVFREEPRLERDFGTSYQEYRKTVRRWI
jgi:protein-S-isoprenylcysteine O-methyltransferase Ste14